MNTNSKPLSTYDIIVAEVEDVTGQSLHDLEAELDSRQPEVARYAALSDLILTASSLLQGQLPSQRGAWNMDTTLMIANWETMEIGLKRMATFLKGEGIPDEKRLPTNAVLAVIAALYADIPEVGDKRGQDELLLRRYLWYAFFTDRYENSAPTHAFSDFNALRGIIRGDSKPDDSMFGLDDVPIFAEHHLVEPEELTTAEWPKRASIRSRGILAVASRLGALDFATGERLDSNNINHRHYHHVFPAALLEEAEIESYLALNCALITDTTNMSIGRKEPLRYLRDRYEWASEPIVRERLQSHLIPVSELANGGYEGLSENDKVEKTKKDFDAFIRKRAELMIKAVRQLADGHQLSPAQLYAD